MLKWIEDPDSVVVTSLTGIETSPKEMVADAMARAAMVWTINTHPRGRQRGVYEVHRWLAASR